MGKEVNTSVSFLATGSAALFGWPKFTSEVQHFLYKVLAIDVIEAALLDGPEFSRVKRYR